MSRRRRKGGQSVSLFPFLSILACVIGVLTLMLAAMALGELNPESLRAAEVQIRSKADRVRMFEVLKGGVRSTEQEVEQVRRKIGEASRLNDQLEAAKAELRQLEADQVRLGASDTSSVQLLSQAHDLRHAIVELTTDKATLTQEVERLKAKLDERLAPATEAVVQITGGGTGTNLIPTFIECTAINVIVYHNEDRRTRIRRSDLSRSDTFAKILDAIRATPNGMAVFLIREDGLRTYFVGRSIARMRGCPNGKVPVLGQGRLDLTAFDEQMRRQAVPDGLIDTPEGPEPGDNGAAPAPAPAKPPGA